MLKDTSYCEKFAMISEWSPLIFQEIKKEIKNDHLKTDFSFSKKYFNGKPAAKLTMEEIIQGYERALEQDPQRETIAEFLSQRWLAKHTDLYDFFSNELSAISPNFSELEFIEDEKSKPMIAKGLETFSPIDLYLFCVLNSVVYSKEVFDELNSAAKEEWEKRKQISSSVQPAQTVEQLQTKYEQQITRLIDNYEKKLTGWQRKYFNDIDQLKKQIAALQRRLNGLSQ